MPESKDPKHAKNTDRQFITEKIEKPPMTNGQMIKRGLVVCFLAVIFGAIAAVTFTLTQAWMNQKLKPEEETGAPVQIPKDEITETTAEISETVEKTETEPEAPVEQLVQEAVENYKYTMDDVKNMAISLRGRMATAETQSIVTVHSVQEETDWFDNPVEMTGIYAGAIVAQTDTELLVMTPQAAVSQADSIKVTFADGAEVAGRMKQQDTLSGVAIVSVEQDSLTTATLSAVRPLVLGNSYLVREGDMLIAVGAPAGTMNSCAFGFVSNVQKNVQVTDRTARAFYADMLMDGEKGTFFLNADGELIGWVMDAPISVTSASGLKMIMGISDYKGTLEALSNGLAAPYIGIQGQTVTEAMKVKGMPAGIYVLSVVNDSPAYSAGIQSGDIIVGINRSEVRSGKEYQGILDNLNCGQLIHVTVARGGREGYQELEFQMTVGAR